MPDTKISDLPVSTSFDGTESMAVVQGGITKQVAPSQIGVVLYNDTVNDTATSATGSMETFNLGSTVSVPTMAIGDKIDIKMTFNNLVAPASDGYGIYFLWDNIKYTPFSASTPTYGNSLIKFPYNKDACVVDIEVIRESATEVYVYYQSKVIATALVSTYENGECGFYLDTLNTDSATHFEVQSFVTTGGEITLEHLYIKHTK